MDGGARGLNAKLHFRLPDLRINTTTMKSSVSSILRDRDIPHRRDVIDSAFQDPRNAEWASTHLRPDTLLSKDELALYAATAHQLTIPTDSTSGIPSLKALVLSSRSCMIQNLTPRDRSSKMTSDARSSPSRLQRQRSRNKRRP